ncbi:unnamed protein product [Phytophthora lilii]|uniref:Unnamed protein product n=1 Tax=Phytophthora lilii TaxID=2077276 RepID=A0A9W6TIV3_9STRA|nr:unnamed protein product [Phytophthora lilii]
MQTHLYNSQQVQVLDDFKFGESDTCLLLELLGCLEMQTIHENVKVFVSQRDLHARATKPDGTSATTTALQYVAENTGFDVVTFRVDFSESANIKLHRPVEQTRQGANTLQKATQELTFDCELHPFERLVLAYVIKRGKKRAFVRVHYTVTAVATPSVDEVAQAQEVAAAKLRQLLQRSIRTFSYVSKWEATPCRPGAEVVRTCAEINQYFQDCGEVFVDAGFPPVAKSLYNSSAPNKLSEDESAVYALCSWEHLHNVADSSWSFAPPSKTGETSSPEEPVAISALSSGLPHQDSFLCALSIITPYSELWLNRWFPSLNAVYQVDSISAIPVAFCIQGRIWQHLLIDLFFPSFPLGRGLMVPRRNDSSSELAQLRLAVETTLLQPRHRSASSLVIVALRKIDACHGAFQLTLRENEASGTISVVLLDPSRKYLRDKLVNVLPDLNRDQDPAEMCMTWEQLFLLEPTLWSLSLGRRHEQRLKRVLLHRSGTASMRAVVSVPTLSTFVFSSSYSNYFTWKTPDVEQEGNQQPQVDLDVKIEIVENDFSLSPLESSDTTRRHTSLVGSDKLGGSQGGVFRKQRPGCTESHPSKAEEAESAKDKTVLTPASVEENLQLVFDCLDRKGRYELSVSDLSAFLQLYERGKPTQHGNKLLQSFMFRHGRLSNLRSPEWGLTVDDFREIYVDLAVQDCSEAKTASDSIRPRFQELVWQDLQRLLPSEADSKSCCEIERQDVVELVCSFHSGTSLLDAVLLPDEKKSLQTDNFNV